MLSLTKDIENCKRIKGGAVNMELLNQEKRQVEIKLMH